MIAGVTCAAPTTTAYHFACRSCGRTQTLTLTPSQFIEQEVGCMCGQTMHRHIPMPDKKPHVIPGRRQECAINWSLPEWFPGADSYDKHGNAQFETRAKQIEAGKRAGLVAD